MRCKHASCPTLGVGLILIVGLSAGTQQDADSGDLEQYRAELEDLSRAGVMDDTPPRSVSHTAASRGRGTTYERGLANDEPCHPHSNALAAASVINRGGRG